MTQSTHVIACPRRPVKKLLGQLPVRFIEALEQNQKIASCCRHPENHEIEAWYSTPAEKAPDIYINYCTCGCKHTRFMLGSGDRPVWEVR